AEYFAQRDSFSQDIEEHASGDGDPVPTDDDRPFQLSNIFNLLANLAIPDIPLGFAVAAERVEVDRPGHAHDLPCIADHEHAADRLSLAPLPTNFSGQIYNGPKRFQRDFRVQLAQFLGAEALEVFTEVDYAQTINVF